MSVELKVRIERVKPSDGVYRVDVDIIDAVGIPMTVLVFAQDDDKYSNVATVYDLETWPDQPQLNRSYYRGRAVKAYFNKLNDAVNFEEITRSRLKTLVSQWSTVVNKFTGVEYVHFSTL